MSDGVDNCFSELWGMAISGAMFPCLNMFRVSAKIVLCNSATSAKAIPTYDASILVVKVLSVVG